MSETISEFSFEEKTTKINNNKNNIDEILKLCRELRNSSSSCQSKTFYSKYPHMRNYFVKKTKREKENKLNKSKKRKQRNKKKKKEKEEENKIKQKKKEKGSKGKKTKKK